MFRIGQNIWQNCFLQFFRSPGTPLWSNLCSHEEKKSPFCWLRFGCFCIRVYRVKGIKSFHPTCAFGIPNFFGSLWPVWSILPEGRLPHRIQKKTSSLVFVLIGRAAGLAGHWSRTFCKDDSTSQSTVRAFCTAIMQIVCQCLTEVFSLSVGDELGNGGRAHKKTHFGDATTQLCHVTWL